MPESILFTTITIGLTFLLSYITYRIFCFYKRYFLYPKGPIPLPLIGNILLFRGHKLHPLESFQEIRKKYGPIYTFYMGSDPYVIIFDLKIAKDLFSKSCFSGRQISLIGSFICSDNANDIIFCDYSENWHSLRTVFKLAVRKYASTQQLAQTISQVVDNTVKDSIINESVGQPFDPKDCIEIIFYCVVLSIAFGKIFTSKDQEYQRLHEITDRFFQLGDKLALIEFVPILRLPLYRYVQKFHGVINDYKKLIADKLDEHIQTYDNRKGIRDFCDAMIAAKLEAIDSNKESAPYLTDQNIALAMWDIFVTATDDTQFSFHWMLILLANYPDVQQQIRDEINQKIGHKVAIQEDIDECHYINAFISETLRFRCANPLGVPHKTMANTEIDGLSIPAQTTVIVHQYSILTDPKYWSDPLVFRPERFMENGRYVSTRPQAYIPFGVGRRKCLGDRLALNELFLILVQFMQSTNDYDIILPAGPETADLKPNPDQVVLFCTPKPYKIALKKHDK
ncbi:steroid 17-alpha-hydroxylase/17,20 lyase-like [Oppia nitens]|uniref:steroid 17-alpha-hydroxylase/17,20 lyase-like n=1 Tax=Oppia nitens TaxID=1686743 RepID=UPI0023DB4964|nr:steroid 17-alpha-hydroxylase/17,20 lyase-like [Oppia nitens]